MILCTSAGVVSIMAHGLVDFLHLELMLWILLGMGMALTNLVDGSLRQG